MQLQDHYTILGLLPSASADEIKRAYWRLAQMYHPDKTPGDPYAHARFTLIKEAYETLSNPSSKEQYLQQRWYARSMGKRPAATLMTPVEILKQLLELDRYVHSSDVHRLEQDGLFRYITEILSEENIHLLNSFNETEANTEMIRATVRCCSSMPYEMARTLAGRLERIKAGADIDRWIANWLRDRKRAAWWDKRRTWIILLLVLVICVIIFLGAGR